MALEECPHMVARCPHHRSECSEDESLDCLYVKNTTATALYTLEYLKGGAYDLQTRYEDQLNQISDFMRSTNEKQKARE